MSLTVGVEVKGMIFLRERLMLSFQQEHMDHLHRQHQAKRVKSSSSNTQRHGALRRPVAELAPVSSKIPPSKLLKHGVP